MSPWRLDQGSFALPLCYSYNPRWTALDVPEFLLQKQLQAILDSAQLAVVASVTDRKVLLVVSPEILYWSNGAMYDSDVGSGG